MRWQHIACVLEDARSLKTDFEGRLIGAARPQPSLPRLDPTVHLPPPTHCPPASLPCCSRFGDYRKDDPESFQLRPQLSYYPQFMFNFRRSQFIQVGGWLRVGG